MSKILVMGDYKLSFICPGCNGRHVISHNDPEGGAPNWDFNGNFDNPTISPSILVRGTVLTDKGDADIKAWCDAGYPKRIEPFESIPRICHSYITDGNIQFLSDCTHELAGQTVPLQEIE